MLDNPPHFSKKSFVAAWHSGGGTVLSICQWGLPPLFLLTLLFGARGYIYCLKKIIPLYNKKGVRRYYEVCSIGGGVDVCVCWSGVYYEEGVWLGRGMDILCYGEFWFNGGRQPVKLV